MEMTNRRWLAVVAVVCALIAAFRLPPRANVPAWVPTFTEARSDLRATLRKRMTQLHEAAVLVARRDSLLAAATVAGARSAPLVVRLVKDAAAADTVHERAIAQAAVIGARSASLVLGIAKDTSAGPAMRVNYRTDRQFILPSATDGESCITVVRLGRGRPEMASSQTGIFGPCAYYAAFGSPGTAAGEWLRKRQYDVALNPVWPLDARPNPSLLRIRRMTAHENLRQWLDFDRGFHVLMNVSRCSSGDVDECARAMRRTPARAPELLGDGVIIESRVAWFETSLGADRHSFLADLLAVHGRGRFEKFWKASGDLEGAFKSAFGESTGEWTMRWMRYRYGKDTRGPLVAPRSALVSLMTALAFVAVCAVAAQRREAL